MSKRGLAAVTTLGARLMRDHGEALAARDGWVCNYCGIRLTPLDESEGWDWHASGRYRMIQAWWGMPTIDHRVPKAFGGTHELDNICLACSTCNTRKGTKSVSEFVSLLKAGHWGPRRMYDV